MSIIRFTPFYKARLWGGTALQSRLGRVLPEGEKIGESWELVDRPDTCSTILEIFGQKEGDEEMVGGLGQPQTLHDLWKYNRVTLFGSRAPDAGRFPILIKLLDSTQVLSVQVHPREDQSRAIGHEPKTEMWYFLHTEPGAKIYAGLKAGVSRKNLEESVSTPKLSQLLHTLPTSAGESMFLPSGRVHAIGEGNLIFEVQQNSDTTYRLDDWGRIDQKTGKPRELQVTEALGSIRYNDYEPGFVQPHGDKVVECVYFFVRHRYLLANEGLVLQPRGETFHFNFVVKGEIEQQGRKFQLGEGWFVTANHEDYELGTTQADGAEVLTVEFPRFS